MNLAFKSLNVLIIGSGGREHALYESLILSPYANSVFVLPGNAGIPKAFRIKDIDASMFSDVLITIRRYNINCVVVGPEKCLVEGLGDFLAHNAPEVLFFGPSSKAAALEGSKIYCKQICKQYGIPTAPWSHSDNIDHAKRILRSRGVPVVIKADGLCAGKGVTVATSIETALAALDDLLVKRIHRKAGESVVIEDALVGRELSVMALCDGVDVMLLPPARDYKRLRGGPEGPDNPNTGGMGAFAPLPDISSDMLLRIKTTIIEPLVKAMKAEGAPYKGVLYAGIMLTDEGPMLLEVNCRFGDPETQAVLPLLKGDLLSYLVAVCNGTLGEMEPLLWKDKISLCVNMTSGGYPSPTFSKGFTIRGLREAEAEEYTRVYHAGTEVSGDSVITAGGRVLSVVGVGRNIREASDNAYLGVGMLGWKDEYHRFDIGK